MYYGLKIFQEYWAKPLTLTTNYSRRTTNLMTLDFNPWKAKAFLGSEKPKPFGFQPKVFQKDKDIAKIHKLY